MIGTSSLVDVILTVCKICEYRHLAFSCERLISQMNILANGSLPVLDVLVFFSSAILLIHRWVYYNEDILPIMNRMIEWVFLVRGYVGY